MADELAVLVENYPAVGEQRDAATNLRRMDALGEGYDFCDEGIDEGIDEFVSELEPRGKDEAPLFQSIV